MIGWVSHFKLILSQASFQLINWKKLSNYHCRNWYKSVVNWRFMKKQSSDFMEKCLFHKWRELSMIGNGFEFYFHWRKTFDVMIKKKEKVQRSHFPTILPHFCANFYSSKSLIFPCGPRAWLLWFNDVRLGYTDCTTCFQVLLKIMDTRHSSAIFLRGPLTRGDLAVVSYGQSCPTHFIVCVPYACALIRDHSICIPREPASKETVVIVSCMQYTL